MKRILIYIAIVFFTKTSYGQVVKGSVKDRNHKPVQGASIAIKNSYDGAIADSSGNFSFQHKIEAGDTLEVTASGYNPVIKSLNDSYNFQNIVLVEQITEMKAVVVSSAGAFVAGSNKKGVVMSALDIVTTAQNGDVTTALKALPGAQQVGEQEGLFVRGGTAKETKQYMDGAIIANPYFKGNENYAQRGRYNPFLFNGTYFSTGAYSALYGDALSSVVLLQTVDMPERSDISFTISPIQLQAGTQHLAKNKRFSWGANYAVTAVSPYFNLLKPRVEFFNGPTYHTADINFRAKTKNGIVKFFTSFGNNHVGMRSEDVDSASYKDATMVKNNNFYSNFNWTENLKNKWKLIWSNSFTFNRDGIDQKVVNSQNQPKQFVQTEYWMTAKNFSVINKENTFQSRLVFEKKFHNLNAVRFGGEYNFLNSNVNYNTAIHVLKDNAAAAFAETDKYFSNDLALTIGLRTEYSSVIEKFNLMPRASLAYRVGKGQQLTAAYGLFYQRPDPMYLMRNAALGYTQATHYLFNYTKSFSQRLIRAEVYYKKYKGLIKTIPLANMNNNYNNDGSGYAKGIDLFWKDRKTLPGFEYWISYSYIDTKRNYLNYPEMLQPHYATPHTVSVVLKRFFMPIKTQFNLTYSFATGRPYYYFQQTSNAFVKKDEGKTINFNNVGFSINYVPYAGKQHVKTQTILVATVSNLLNTKQIYGYTYSYNGAMKQPILPAARQFFYLGLFINIGTDRTQQIINDNL